MTAFRFTLNGRDRERIERVVEGDDMSVAILEWIATSGALDGRTAESVRVTITAIDVVVEGKP